MLDQFLAVTYNDHAEKTAQEALVARMRTMPLDVIEKVAFGGGPCDIKGGAEAKCWLDNFKGTPLFTKAVELERAEIQLEQQDIENRLNAQSQDTWTKRDAIRLQKKMLELDLALEGAGSAGAAAPAVAGGNPEAEEEQGIALLEQAQAQEAAAGEGNSPEEKMENDAIAELHAAHGEGAPPAKTQEEGKPPTKAPPKPPAKKEEAEESPKAKEEVGAKVAGALAAGQLLAKIAVEIPPAALAGGLFGANKAHKAGENPIHGTVRGALGADGGLALGQFLGGTYGAALAHKLHADPLAGLNLGRLAGGLAGGVGGYKLLTREYAKPKHKEAADLTQAAREKIKPSNFAEPKADGPGDTGKYPIEDKAHARSALGLVGMHGSDAEKAKVRSAVARKYPDLEKKAAPSVSELRSALKTAGIGTGIMGVANGAKSLVGTAMKAGGLPQVAKSVGNVAAGFAKANPLAAAGTAAGAGLLAGRMSKSSS